MKAAREHVSKTDKFIKKERERTMKEELKKILFIKAVAALEAYQAAVKTRYPSEEAKYRHERFCAIWDVIEEAGLAEEYETWKEG